MDDSIQLNPMKQKKSYFFYFKVAIILSIFYWIVESILHHYVYQEPNFEFIPLDADEIWMRCTSVFLMMSFGFFADIQSNKLLSELNKEKTIVEKAKADSIDIAEKYKSIVDTAINGIATINSKGIIRSINPAFIRQFGYDEKEILGENINQIMPSPFKEEHDMYLKNYTETGERKIIGIGREVIGKRKNGSTFPLHLSVSEYLLNGEKMYTGIIHDLTEQYKNKRKMDIAKEVAEITGNKLRQTNNSLVQAVEDAEKYQRQLIESSKMASLGAMSSGMAHELNQPLGAILLKAQLVPKLVEKGFYDKILSVNEDIKNQSLRAKKIMDSLRVFSREDKEIALESCDMISILNDILTMYTDEFRLANINLEINFENNDLIFKGSIVQIGEVLSNILSNARDALEDLENKNINIRAYLEQEYVVIEISDSGCGIPEDKIANIYEPFYTSKPIGKGTGLGLSLSYSMVKNSGGEILVDSKIGKGTTFKLIFPKSKET